MDVNQLETYCPLDPQQGQPSYRIQNYPPRGLLALEKQAAQVNEGRLNQFGDMIERDVFNIQDT